ncbi:hypothetical protein [Salinigranum marinum]|nr:hypothetical protein [Salinigranum marinum]
MYDRGPPTSYEVIDEWVDGVGLSLLVTVCIPAASYLYAVGRYRRYTVD